MPARTQLNTPSNTKFLDYKNILEPKIKTVVQSPSQSVIRTKELKLTEYSANDQASKKASQKNKKGKLSNSSKSNLYSNESADEGYMQKRKQRSIIGGIACKFQFLKDHNKVHNMRSWCHESASRHKQKISSTISQMENDSQQDLNCKYEEIALKDECRRTKYEL